MNKKMDGLLEKILEQNARDKRERIFHYCSYWGSWSRRLKQYDEGEIKGIVEVNLTPLSNCHSSSWQKDIMPVVFRIHGTSPDRNDRDEKELPPSVLAMMKTNIGEELTNKLLTEDWLSMIDLELLRRNSNGGCPLEKCALFAFPANGV